MHPTADTTALIISRGLGWRVMPGVRRFSLSKGYDMSKRTSVSHLSRLIVCGLLWFTASSLLCGKAAHYSLRQSDSAWLRLNTSDEDFSIFVPTRGTVAVQGNYVLAGGGGLVTEERVASAYYRGVVYVVKFYRADSPNKLAKAYPKVFYLSEHFDRKVSVDGIEGEQFVKKGERLNRITQIFRTRKRVYVIEAASRDAKNPYVEWFFSSLKLGTQSAVENQKGDPMGRGAENVKFPDPPSDEGTRAAEGDKIYPAVAIYKASAPLTQEARMARVNGEVRLKILISATGAVEVIKVVKGLGHGLDESAAQAARISKFLPAEKDGVLISQEAEITYGFRIV
jgi:TonB family protein